MMVRHSGSPDRAGRTDRPAFWGPLNRPVRFGSGGLQPAGPPVFWDYTRVHQASDAASNRNVHLGRASLASPLRRIENHRLDFLCVARA